MLSSYIDIKHMITAPMLMPTNWTLNLKARVLPDWVGQQSNCGIISTKAMYKNIPAMAALSHESLMRPTNTPIDIPTKHNKPDKALYIIALLTDRPALNRTAKSPISWGSSWHRTAIVVLTPEEWGVSATSLDILSILITSTDSTASKSHSNGDSIAKVMQTISGYDSIDHWLWTRSLSLVVMMMICQFYYESTVRVGVGIDSGLAVALFRHLDVWLTRVGVSAQAVLNCVFCSQRFFFGVWVQLFQFWNSLGLRCGQLIVFVAVVMIRHFFSHSSVTISHFLRSYIVNKLNTIQYIIEVMK